MIKTKKDFKKSYEWTSYIGHYAEQRFDEECAKKNILCLTPNSTQRFDRVIDYNGEMKRVQIKATSAESDGHVYRLRLGCSNATPYNKNDIDFIAMYATDTNYIYLIPFSLLFIKIKGKKYKSMYVYDAPVSPRVFKNAINITKYRQW